MRFRLKAFGLHLTGSACALTLILGGLYLGWYRWPGWYLTGVLHVLIIVGIVDLGLGPTLTLIIANPRKLPPTRHVLPGRWICYLQRPEHRYRILAIGLATHSCARAQLAVEVIRLQTAPSRLANMLASTAILVRDCKASK